MTVVQFEFRWTEYEKVEKDLQQSNGPVVLLPDNTSEISITDFGKLSQIIGKLTQQSIRTQSFNQGLPPVNHPFYVVQSQSQDNFLATLPADKLYLGLFFFWQTRYVYQMSFPK